MAAAIYALLTDPNEIAAAFTRWRSALTEAAQWRGDSWWLAEERIVFGNRNDRKEPELGAYVVLGTDPTGTNVTVQLNEPQQYGNENPLSGVARDPSGRLHLVRQGVLHQNAQSPRVAGATFRERTRLRPILVTIGSAAAKRDWFIVTALDLPAAQIRRNVARFVDLCSIARAASDAREAAQDDERLDDLFGKDEVGGESTCEATVNANRRKRLQGEVWLALQRLLRADGRELRKPRHARGYEVDGEIATTSGKLLIEIKTTALSNDVYGGVGQLLLYPQLIPRLRDHRRILLMPGTPTDPLIAAIEACGVELHRYRLSSAGAEVDIAFSPEFLRLCELE